MCYIGFNTNYTFIIRWNALFTEVCFVDFSINNEQSDMLAEIVNIGISNAATSLSSILNKPIKVSVPLVKTVDIGEIGTELGGDEKLVAGILFTLSGDIEGMLLFLIEDKFAADIIKTLFNKDDIDILHLDEMSISTFTEIANIMAGNYLNAMSSMTEFNINYSVPYFNVDMLGAIINIPATIFGRLGDKALLFEEKIIGVGKDFDSYLMLVPTIESLNKILNKFGGEYGTAN